MLSLLLHPAHQPFRGRLPGALSGVPQVSAVCHRSPCDLCVPASLLAPPLCMPFNLILLCLSLWIPDSSSPTPHLPPQQAQRIVRLHKVPPHLHPGTLSHPLGQPLSLQRETLARPSLASRFGGHLKSLVAVRWPFLLRDGRRECAQHPPWLACAVHYCHQAELCCGSPLHFPCLSAAANGGGCGRGSRQRCSGPSTGVSCALLGPGELCQDPGSRSPGDRGT